MFYLYYRYPESDAFGPREFVEVNCAFTMREIEIALEKLSEHYPNVEVKVLQRDSLGEWEEVPTIYSK